jgi:hypothetical protein
MVLDRFGPIGFGSMERIIAVPQDDGTVALEPDPSVSRGELATLQQGLNEDDVREMAKCWAKAGYHTYLWGWSVCLDRPCADRLQEMLSGFGTPKASALLLAVLKGWLKGATLQAASKAAAAAAGGPLVTVLAVLSFYIALMIGLNKTQRGVCISGNWTVPLPFIGSVLGQFVWCKGR